jgi:predicted DsbA family dithiol-disulfide isomerase
MGVSGVPFYVFEGKWAVSGAQSTEFFESALREVAAQA